MQVRLVLEFTTQGAAAPTMRWERTAPADGTADAFELLGRAFEVAQREQAAAFDRSLIAFFRGAMIQRPDVDAVLAKMSPENL
jgi:hypothetical protein